MKKLKLNLEELCVESFDTSRSDGSRAGTVRGHNTLAYSCDDSCGCPLGTEGIDCYATAGSGCSFHSPHQSMCDISCEFACPLTYGAAGC